MISKPPPTLKIKYILMKQGIDISVSHLHFTVIDLEQNLPKDSHI